MTPARPSAPPASPILALVMALLTLLLPLLLCGPARAEPSDIAAAARSVVRVVLLSEDEGRYGLEGHGSGFAVGPDLVVTNAHVVQSARGDDRIRIGVVPPEGGGAFARIVAFAPERDLALLRIEGARRLPVATLFIGLVTDGEDVFAVGYPGNVDLAQGLNVGDIVSATSPVKTRGSVSSGRSSKAYETILHTAPLGAGNSGGPLFDGCGRVLGANSFGTVFSGGDSEFYFAVSTREIMRFLLGFGVTPRAAGNPCRSIAQLDEAETARVGADRARADAAERAAAAKQAEVREHTLQQALFEVAEERETRLGIAGLALLLAIVAGAGAWAARERGRSGIASAAAFACGLLLLGAGGAMLARPGFGQVEDRAAALRERAMGSASRTPSEGDAAALSGRLICVIQPERSRVTVSDMADIPLDWRGDGCVNGQSQYGLDDASWVRVLVPESEQTVTVSRFDSSAREYRIERHYLDLAAMAPLRAARAKLAAPTCGASEEAARSFGEAQAGLRAMLQGPPNERLIYRCSPAGASTLR